MQNPRFKHINYKADIRYPRSKNVHYIRTTFGTMDSLTCHTLHLTANYLVL